MNELAKIPSEYIEPYLQRFLMLQIEGVAMGLTPPQEARDYLKGVEYFVECFCGIHSKYAVSNRYGQFIKLSDEQMISICQKTMKAELSEPNVEK